VGFVQNFGELERLQEAEALRGKLANICEQEAKEENQVLGREENLECSANGFPCPVAPHIIIF